MDLYQQELMDHYRYPRNRGVLDNPDIATESFNPSCGDKISFQLLIVNDTVAALRFEGSGCVISQAAASMLSELCIAKSLDALLALTTDTMTSLVGIPLGPTRLRCALLSLEALHKGILEYRAHPQKGK
ncbi:iron-sulfur cluster assembly scaffold protein [Candidatus Dependentiae bacterium]|nr:iron-sulfur cluster assembly scaffold protein [Candidatus Dependentiae bacterium]